MDMKHVVLDGQHDGRQLRNALGRFPTGVTVITARAPDGKMEGLTANSFAALSLDPPLVLWSINHNSPSVAGFKASGHFAINVLRADQTDLSHRFATKREHKFEGLDFAEGVGGSPVLGGVLATFECEITQMIEGGDHLLFVGRVHKLAYGEGEPLIFNAGKYSTARPLSAGSAATDLNGVWSGLG
jgi:flavin reductase (DIM6/NTAB) family NADH-FMN oxidoreductase RutF